MKTVFPGVQAEVNKFKGFFVYTGLFFLPERD
jgi:hypothetical protein